MRDLNTNKYASPNGYYNDYYSNPWFRLDNYRTKYQDNNFNGNMEIAFKILPWLTVVDKLSAMNNAFQEKSTVGQFFHSTWAKSQARVPAPWDQGDGNGITRALSDLQGSVADNSSNQTMVNNEFQFLITKNFNSFSTKVLLGNNIYSRKTKSVSVNSSSIVV